MRSVMEYALGTMWLADAGEDAVDVLNRRLQGSKRKLRADLELDSISLADFPAEAVRTFMDTLAAQLPPHPDERLSAFRHLLQEYGFEKMIPVYDVILLVAPGPGRQAITPRSGRSPVCSCYTQQ